LGTLSLEEPLVPFHFVLDVYTPWPTNLFSSSGAIVQGAVRFGNANTHSATGDHTSLVFVKQDLDRLSGHVPNTPIYNMILGPLDLACLVIEIICITHRREPD
jgi:hypothetical protein